MKTRAEIDSRHCLSLAVGVLFPDCKLTQNRVRHLDDVITLQNESVRAMRTLVWLDNAQFVKEKNAENNGATFKLNQYADLVGTLEELSLHEDIGIFN